MTLTHEHLSRIIDVAHAGDLQFVDLVGLAELDPATAFRGKVLRGTDLRRQDLRGFNFNGAVFIDCDFEGAKLVGCDFCGADLSNAKGITLVMLAEAMTDAETRSPIPQASLWFPGCSTSWAEPSGNDRYGPWVTLRVPGTEVRQRLRWIPPGAFMIGSPDSEPGRFVNEGPQLGITISRGYWMFETSCSEELWQAVMCKEPCNPRGPRFPITNVSWNEAQAFVSRLNSALPSLGASLPSEARWEYGCRAGTDTAYCLGSDISKEQVCFDSSTPVPVGALPPNQWGVHEMHGNVMEWCEDHWHDNYLGAPSDGSAWLDGAALRVIRGGSYGHAAREVRAAYRVGIEPGISGVQLGFRCVVWHSPCEVDSVDETAV